LSTNGVLKTGRESGESVPLCARLRDSRGLASYFPVQK